MDDGGMIHSANTAMADLRKFGLARSASGMLPCPAINEFADLANQGVLDDVGIHITLTSEWKHYKWGPVAPADTVKSLVNGHFFWSSLAKVMFHSLEPDGEREIGAQVGRAFELGLHPTHIDTHMATILAHPEWIRAYLDIGKHYHIPPMLTRDVILGVNSKWLKILKPTLELWVHQAEKEGFLSLNTLFLDVKKKTYGEQKAAYEKVLRNLKPGVTQIIIHPAYADDDFKVKVISSKKSEIRRDFDARVFQDPDIRQLISDLHIKLFGWKDIQAVFPWQSLKP
jgi:chitin disaccharide deacetylase